MRNIFICFATILLLLLIMQAVGRKKHHLVTAQVHPMPLTTLFVAHTFTDSHHQTLAYRLCSPMNIEAGRRYPLLLFLHGAGEKGNDNITQLNVIGPVVADPDFRRRFPCYILVPQCPANSAWVYAHYAGHRFIPSRNPITPIRQVHALLDYLQTQLYIDTHRIYVGGNSMGGSGTWDMIARDSTMFAAAFPMCGRGDTASAVAIAHLPIWVFHNSGDPLVDVCWSRDMVNALRAHGGQPRFSEYPESSHDCWSRALQEPELFPWLFAQHKP